MVWDDINEVLFDFAETRARHNARRFLVCVWPSHLDDEGVSIQAAGDQRYGSRSPVAEAGCVGSRDNSRAP